MSMSYKKMKDESEPASAAGVITAVVGTPAGTLFRPAAQAATVKAAPAPAPEKAKTVQQPLEKALKALCDHKSTGSDFTDTTQLIRKANIVMQLGVSDFETISKALAAQKKTVAMDVLQNIAKAKGGAFEAAFNKAKMEASIEAAKPLFDASLMTAFS